MFYIFSLFFLFPDQQVPSCVLFYFFQESSDSLNSKKPALACTNSFWAIYSLVVVVAENISFVVDYYEICINKENTNIVLL